MEYPIDKISNEQLDELALESKSQVNSLGISVPYQYFVELTSLNWHDILFAVKNGLLPYESAVEHAIVELESNENCSQTILDLACLSSEEAKCYHSIQPCLDELANLEPETEKSKTKDKIMFCLLDWVFNHRSYYDDPLRVVEYIYDDFSFPESIASFVRYKPTEQPMLDTIEANVKRLYENWEKFLDIQKAK